eukprot:Gregarina_sp_Poly_1__10462@NODE_761_length_6399_cov_244_304169_g561_i0_p6_GENE_NODE_761_length_6399_cov_244_304169_g561_i0NODE_761_length_6399_cov_244_304169_g561_i0_p6_ORF_typecomplete_len175_score22_33PAC3/PF10178_9/7_1e02PAC3/PF10178_9/0_16_NODE_761_length_6399_cov_244_304169_g561_i025383062
MISVCCLLFLTTSLEPRNVNREIFLSVLSMYAKLAECRSLLLQSKEDLLTSLLRRIPSKAVLIQVAQKLNRLDQLVAELSQKISSASDRELFLSLEGIKEKTELREKVLQLLISRLISQSSFIENTEETQSFLFGLACENLDRDEQSACPGTCTSDPLQLERLVLSKPFNKKWR